MHLINKLTAILKLVDKVHLWGAWITNKPKGWHEIRYCDALYYEIVTN